MSGSTSNWLPKLMDDRAGYPAIVARGDAIGMLLAVSRDHRSRSHHAEAERQFEIESSRLFAAKRDDRINSGGSPSRQVAGNQPHRT